LKEKREEGARSLGLGRKKGPQKTRSRKREKKKKRKKRIPLHQGKKSKTGIMA